MSREEGTVYDRYFSLMKEDDEGRITEDDVFIGLCRLKFACDFPSFRRVITGDRDRLQKWMLAFATMAIENRERLDRIVRAASA